MTLYYKSVSLKVAQLAMGNSGAEGIKLEDQSNSP